MKRIITLIVVVICSTSYGYRDLETGTFLTRDPAGFKDGPNQYCYVHCNPVNKIDPHGLWGVLPGFGGRAHQYITKRAIKQSGVKMNVFKRMSRIRGAATRADIRWSHRNPDNNYRHSTAIGGSAKETRDNMIKQAMEWYDKGGSDGLGKLYHMVADSFCPGHTDRNSKGEIEAFLDHGAQKQLEGGSDRHKELDKIKDEDGNIRPEVQQSIDAVAGLMKLTENDPSKENREKVREYLNENVYKTVENPTVRAGNEFSDLTQKTEDTKKDEVKTDED